MVVRWFEKQTLDWQIHLKGGRYILKGDYSKKKVHFWFRHVSPSIKSGSPLLDEHMLVFPGTTYRTLVSQASLPIESPSLKQSGFHSCPSARSTRRSTGVLTLAVLTTQVVCKKLKWFIDVRLRYWTGRNTVLPLNTDSQTVISHGISIKKDLSLGFRTIYSKIHGEKPKIFLPNQIRQTLKTTCNPRHLFWIVFFPLGNTPRSVATHH